MIRSNLNIVEDVPINLEHHNLNKENNNVLFSHNGLLYKTIIPKNRYDIKYVRINNSNKFDKQILNATMKLSKIDDKFNKRNNYMKNYNNFIIKEIKEIFSIFSSHPDKKILYYEDYIRYLGDQGLEDYIIFQNIAESDNFNIYTFAPIFQDIKNKFNDNKMFLIFKKIRKLKEDRYSNVKEKIKIRKRIEELNNQNNLLNYY